MSGIDFMERVDSVLKARNEKRLNIAQSVGVSLQSFTDWSKRGNLPRADVALSIARYLGVSFEWLMTGEEAENMPLSEDEKELVRNWRILDDGDKGVVSAMMAQLCRRYSSQNTRR